MLTTDEIRALNEARDILDKLQADCAKRRSERPAHPTAPDGWDYGRVTATAYKAEWEIFQVLNELSSTRAQLIPDLLMHNREERPGRNHGAALDVALHSDEDGYHLTVATDRADHEYVIGNGQDLVFVAKEIQAHLDEGRRAASEHQRQIDDGAYSADDPKHPTYHDRVSDLADRRKP